MAAAPGTCVPTKQEAYKLGNAARVKGDYELAVDRYTRLSDSSPITTMLSSVALFGIRSQRATWTEPFRITPGSSGVRPDFAQAYSNRGAAYEAMQLDKAIEDFTEFIRLKPDDAVAYFQRGAAYTMNREPDKSIADFSEAIRLKPDDASAYTARVWPSQPGRQRRRESLRHGQGIDAAKTPDRSYNEFCGT